MGNSPDSGLPFAAIREQRTSRDRNKGRHRSNVSSTALKSHGARPRDVPAGVRRGVLPPFFSPRRCSSAALAGGTPLAICHVRNTFVRCRDCQSLILGWYVDATASEAWSLIHYDGLSVTVLFGLRMELGESDAVLKTCANLFGPGASK